MKKTLLFISIFFFINTLFSNPQKLNRIAAIANHEVITALELSKQIVFLKKQMNLQKLPVPNDTVLKQQVVDKMITEALILQFAERANIEVNSADIQKAIMNTAKNQHLTVSQFLNFLNQNGLSEKKIEAQFKYQLILEKLQKNFIVPRLSVSQTEVETYFRTFSKEKRQEEYHLQGILIPLPDEPSPKQIEKAMQQAENIIQQLHQGADFNLLAAQIGNAQAPQGGEWGWKNLAELPPSIAERVENLPIGQISAPIQTPQGLNIIRLTGVRPAPGANNKALYNQTYNLIFKRKLEEQTLLWIKQLRETAYIKVFST